MYKNLNNPKIQNPIISVVIAVKNAEKTLQRCFNSIREQTYRKIELIVIDGHSDDRSLSIIKENSDIIKYWNSDEDSGIYEAWNKGLINSTGDWIYFMGADDFFWDDNVLSQSAKYLGALPPNNLIAYGKVFLVDCDGSLLYSVGKPWASASKIFMEMMSLPHQGVFHRSELFTNFGNFNESFKIAGDYELLLRYLKSNESIFFPNLIVSGMQLGGISNNPKNLIFLMKEFRRARQINGISGFSFSWLFALLKTYIRILLLILIGQDGLKFLLKFFKKT